MGKKHSSLEVSHESCFKTLEEVRTRFFPASKGSKYPTTGVKRGLQVAEEIMSQLREGSDKVKRGAPGSRPSLGR